MNSRAAWEVVERFEGALAEYCGAPYAIAVDSCTNALRLCIELWSPVDTEIELPKRTYVGVARAVMSRGFGTRIKWVDLDWSGEYRLAPTCIVDAARWLRRDMYQPKTWTCLSFHATKHLPIGRGGAILCDNQTTADWLRRARYDGRDQTRPIMEQSEFQWGMHCYMEPEKAARGLLLMNALADNNEPLPGIYPDLSTVKFWEPFGGRYQ